MAPLSMPNVPAATGGVSSIASTNSILELGKSEEPFEQQIQEACSILDIDMLSLRRGLEKCVCSPMQKEQKCHLNAPRYEWTLNWLLKKLREKNSTDNACLLPEAWLLLRFLIVYAHPAKVARSLTSNKYTETLKSTLDRLRENPVEAVVRPSSAGMSSELDATKSNSLQRNVDEVNSQDIRSQKSVYQTSKKRKRDEAEISIYEPYSGSLARTRLLFASITGTLVQTEYLLESQTRVSRSIVREQLKYVLRSSSEVAATILGSGIYLVNFVGQREYSDRVVTFQKSEVAEVPLDLEVLESYARIFLTFWGQRAYSDGKEAEHSRFQAFTAKSLLSCLLFLHTCRDSFDRLGPLKIITGEIESLIATNVVQPMRSSALSIFLTDAFLQSPIPQTLQWINDRDEKTNPDVHMITDLMCLFFEIAITDRLTRTSSSRREEESFLRKLFNELKRCAKLKFGPGSLINSPKAYSRSLIFLLEKAAEHNLQLDASTIESVLEEATGLLQDSDSQQITWILVSLCLENNADVFVIPIGAPSGHYSYRKPNRFLDSLFVALAKTRDEADHDQVYGLKLKKIVIPLLYAFAKARDLPSFLEHWKEQLNASVEISQGVPGAESKGKAYQSLWEDDELLNAAQGLIEPSLSSAQLDTILTKLHKRLRELDPKVDGSLSASELVILDCIITGCRAEELLTKLSARVQSIYDALAEVVLKFPQVYGGQRWRLWRVLAAIEWKWSSSYQSQSSMETVNEVAHRAFAVLGEIHDKTGDEDALVYQDYPHAFSVVVARALSDHLRTRTIGPNLLEESVSRLLKSAVPFCCELNESAIDTKGPVEASQLWSGKSRDIRSLDTLLLSCIMQLLVRPTVIGYLDTSTQKQLFGLLARQALRERMNRHDIPQATVSYSWLWTRLQKCELLDEDMRFHRNLRHFQSERYLSFLEPQNPMLWKVDSSDYAMAFESVQEVPVLEFEPEHRIDIANGLFSVVVHTDSLSIQSVPEHLQLLAKFADTPRKGGRFRKILEGRKENLGEKDTSDTMRKESNRLIEKSMEVFHNVTAVDSSPQKRPGVFAISEVISRKPWSIEMVACDDALRRLTHIILEHIFASLSLDTNAQNLRTFYQWMGRELEQSSPTNSLGSPNLTSSSSMLLMTMTALNFYEEHREQASKTLGLNGSVTSSIRLQHLEGVLALLDAGPDVWTRPRDQQKLSTIIECLCGYSDLLATRSDCGYILRTVDDILSDLERLHHVEGPAAFSQWTAYQGYTLRGRYHKLTISLGPSYHPYRDYFSMFEMAERAPHGSEKSMWLNHIREVIQNPELQMIKHIFNSAGLFEGEQRHRCRSLTVLRAILFNVKDEDMHEMRLEASNVFHLLCRGLLVPPGFEEAMLSLQCITLFLQKQPHLISQFHIDTVLSTITKVASRLSSKRALVHTAKVYIGLCRLTAAILDFHRTKLGGRYHLVLPLLQSLLQTLFIPYATTVIAPEQRSGFNKTHAGAYARLLSKLSDPSPSAFGRHKGRQNILLNDETKREKDKMGQHLHYLIMTYCECQLTGKLAEDGMSKALEPGIWSALDCARPEVMRALNAGMNSGGRSVWKRVYEDWKKFGQWRGE